jgi:hypothetical protein
MLHSARPGIAAATLVIALLTAKLFNLRSDPKEETDIKDFNPWVISAIDSIVKNFWTTVDDYPLIPVGGPDPYAPPGR